MLNTSQESTELTPRLANDISIYKGEITTQNLIKNIAKLKKAFPSMPLGFYDILDERIRDNGFSDERFTDAVNHVIDTCPYPTPKISDFISFDKRIKTYSYAQYVRLIDEGENGDNYKPIKLKDRPALVWIHVNDIEQYNIRDDRQK